MAAAANDSAAATRTALHTVLGRLSDDALVSLVSLGTWAESALSGGAVGELPDVAFLPVDRPWLERAAILADQLAGDLDDADTEDESEHVAAAARPAIQHLRTVREEGEFDRPTRYRIEALVDGQPRTGYAGIAEYDAATSAAARFALIAAALSVTDAD